MGTNKLKISAFRQMCGRAGRMGLDTEGEAILMIKNVRMDRDGDGTIADHLINDDIEPLVTSLDYSQGGGVEKLILEMISCGKIKYENQIQEFLNCTLLYVQKGKEKILELGKNALRFIKERHFLFRSEDKLVLNCSHLGKATTLSGLLPRDIALILPSLHAAQTFKLILNGGGFHSVFLATPPLTRISPNWEKYEPMLDALFKQKPHGMVTAVML